MNQSDKSHIISEIQAKWQSTTASFSFLIMLTLVSRCLDSVNLIACSISPKHA